MTEGQIETIKIAMKLYGGCTVAGYRFQETVKRVNNWDQYTGRFNVFRDGEYEPLNDKPVNLDQAIQIAKQDLINA
jgi:hypothetical protein